MRWSSFTQNGHTLKELVTAGELAVIYFGDNFGKMFLAGHELG